MSNNINSSEIIGMAATSFTKHFLSFMFLTLFLVLVSFSVELMTLTTEPDDSPIYIPIVILVFYILAVVKFIITIHRVTLLSENVISSLFTFRKNDLMFFVSMTAVIVVLGLVLAGVFYLLQGQNSGTIMVIALPVVVGIGLVSSRLSLLFPALAIGQPFDIKGVWKAGENHKATLFFIVVVFPYFTGRLLNKIPEDLLYLELLSLAITSLVMTFEVILISHCYDEYHQKANQSDVIDETTQAL